MVAVLADIPRYEYGADVTPRLQAIPGMRAVPTQRRATRLDPSVYRRRRLMVAGFLLLAIAAAYVLMRSAWAGTGGGALTPTGAAAVPGASPAAATSYVVKPGDTLWTIARTLDPDGDERPLVQRLSAELGGTTLYPGQSIPVPSGA